MEQPAGELSAPNDAPPPAFAANPTPTTFPLPPSHPSYAEMITAAIAWDSSQGKEGGSSKRAIAKYIDRVYSNLPPSHSALLTHHLKRLKNSGHLIMVKNSYQLSSAAPPHTGSATPSLSPSPSPSPAVVIPPPPPSSSSSPNPTPKRGPGRPPKPKTLAQPTPTLDNGGSQPAKKRGRPPRQPQIQMAAAEVPFIQTQPEAQAQPPVNDQPKRRPGRPPKQPPVVPFAPPSEPPVNGPAPVAVAAKRRPGRPPKANVAVAAVGRPSTGRPRGRPKRTNALGPVSRPVGKRPRGRPPKQQQQQGGVVATATVTVSGKRRGRPPKGSGPPKFRRLSGKPLGRPRKDAATSRKHMSGQGMANEELTRKLELIQSRVRDAVGILRPYVANENEALIALQQLEEVVAPNATEPPTEPPVAAMPMSVVAPLNASVPVTAAVPPSIYAPPPPLSVTNVAGLVMNAPAPFSVTLPPMTVTAPFHAPSSGVENQQPLSWIASSEAQS